MSGLDRRQFLKLTGGTGAIAMTGLAGCSGGPQSDADGTTTTGEGTTTTAEEIAAHIGMIYATGGLGDGSFNDQAQSGLQEAASDFAIEYNETQPEATSDFGDHQQQFAQSTDPDYDLISSIGFLQADALGETAPNYPDQDFMIVDSVVDESNVASYTFMEHEGSYLVGMLAGLLTQSEFSAGAGSTDSDVGNVGFVGGVKSSLIQKFEAGYRAGVQSVDGGIDVQSTYVGSFSDPTGGKEAALSMYNGGADIVYHASGNTGTGVFEAAQDKGRFAIGVDRDQSVTKSGYSDVILSSMVKRVDTAVYTAIEQVVNDEFEGGTMVTLGLQDDGVENVYGQDLGSEIPSDVKDQISTAREDIIAGDVDVPSDPSNV